MEFLHRIAAHLAEWRSAATIRDELNRLTPRALADLGMTPDDLPFVARVGARLGPQGATLAEIVSEARTQHLQRPSQSASIAELARQALEATELGRRLNLELVWWRAYRRVRAELSAYSDQELMADLRLTRSDIDGIAAEGAEEQVAAFVAAHPAYRRPSLGEVLAGRWLTAVSPRNG